MGFFNKKREFKSSVRALLPTMEIPGFDEIGTFPIYDMIDIGYQKKFSAHETALCFTYSCIPKLAKKDMRSSIALYERTAKKQEEWLKTGLVTQEVVGSFKEMTLVHLDYKR